MKFKFSLLLCLLSCSSFALEADQKREVEINAQYEEVEYTFEEHDETVAYSLSIPFVSTFVFAAVMKHQDAPGTTFKRHMAIAKGVLNEDDYLLQEILFNPRTPAQVEGIRTELNELLDIISRKDAEAMKAFLTRIRQKIK